MQIATTQIVKTRQVSELWMPRHYKKHVSVLTVGCMEQQRGQACCPGELAQVGQSGSTAPPQALTVVSVAPAVQHLHADWHIACLTSPRINKASQSKGHVEWLVTHPCQSDMTSRADQM